MHHPGARIGLLVLVDFPSRILVHGSGLRRRSRLQKIADVQQIDRVRNVISKLLVVYGQRDTAAAERLDAEYVANVRHGISQHLHAKESRLRSQESSRATAALQSLELVRARARRFDLIASRPVQSV